jgi:uncharacterized RDD family membrane protein YckC
MTTPRPLPLVKAGLLPRTIALAIDWIIAAPFGLIGLIPIIGQFFSICFLIPYWLLRDIGGASIGKRLLGLRVVDYNGQVPMLGSRIKRNLIFALPVIALLLPVIGFFGAAVAFLIVSLVEAILIARRGERMGDRDARALVIDVRSSRLPVPVVTAQLPANQPAAVPSAGDQEFTPR